MIFHISIQFQFQGAAAFFKLAVTQACPCSDTVSRGTPPIKHQRGLQPSFNHISQNQIVGWTRHPSHKMPSASERAEKQAAAQEAVDVLHEIATILVSSVLSLPC